MKIIVAILVHCLLFIESTNANNITGNNIKATQQSDHVVISSSNSESDLNRSQKFNDNYKKLLSDSSGDLDILNDSSEVVDEDDALSKDVALKFDDFVSPKELELALEDGSKLLESSLMNVFKVPKSKTKKTLSSRHSSMKNEPVVNDFNSELLFSVNDENLTDYATYFHAFTHLFDHSKWNVNSFSYDISKACLKDMQTYLNDLSMSRDWAVKMSDTSGRYRGQFFFESSYWLGAMELCYEVNNEYSGKIPELQFFVFKFLIKLEPVYHKNKTRILDVGQCLFKSCTQQDANIIMNRDHASLALQQMITLNDGNNTKANEIKIIQAKNVPGNYSVWKDHKFYVFSFVILLLLTLAICASIYENSLIAKGFDINDNKNDDFRKFKNRNHENNNKINDKYEMNHINNNNELESEANKANSHKLGFASKILLCFACGSNAKVILSAKVNADDSLTCIHGLRFFALLWTILVHTYLQMFAIGENRFTRNISERTFIYQLVGNATFSVDTFFFISGLLVVLLFLKSEKSKNKQNDEEINETQEKSDGFLLHSSYKTFMLILYRFIRLTPAYFFIMVLTELSMKITYNQSVFTPGLTDHINCNKYFYRNLFYINNFYPLSEMCMMWSWYLANDFQFYVVTIILLILSTRYFKISSTATILLLLGSWLFTINISLHYGYTHKVAEPFESFDFLYDKPWQRFGPYVMGMIAGYILFRVKEKPKVPFSINLILWTVSLFILFIIIFGVEGGELNLIATSLYVSLGHSAWGFALIWITLSCCWGMANPINQFLSFKAFFPLSRLTYCTYLIHPLIMMMTSFQSDGPVQLRHGLIFTAFLGNAAISFIIAFFISLLVEAPIIRLLKVLFAK